MKTKHLAQPIVFFFIACMGIIIWFFILSGNLNDAASWIYAIFLFIIFSMMMYTGKYSKYRRIFQVVFAIFFAISFIGIMIDERGSMSIPADADSPMCHIVLPILLIPYTLTKTIVFRAQIINYFASVVSMFLIWFLATLVIGRGWCGWVCFYGGWEDGVSRLARKPRISLLSHNREIRSFQYAFFAFIILVSVAAMSSVYCEWFCPFKIITEFEPITDPRSLMEGTIFISAFVGLVLVMPFLTKKRFQCSAFCPFGAFQSLADNLSLYHIRFDTNKCRGCLQCVAACPFCAIDPETITEKRGKPESTCAKCGECIAVCPENAISYEFAFAMKKKNGKAMCSRPEPKTQAGKFVQSILEPQYLFVFSAFTFGLIISSRFVPDALHRIWQLIAGGAN